MGRLAEIRVPPELLAQARAGAEPAFAALYDLLAPAAFALIRRLVSSRAVAEDVFQETMLALFAQLGTVRDDAALGPWLRQVAVSKSLMYLRSPWHRARLGLERAGSDDAGELGPGGASVPPPAECLDLERALASLTPTARAVVWLYEVEGYSHEEIARAFGRSVSFSKSQLARAHRRLREWFEPGSQRQPCTPI